MRFSNLSFALAIFALPTLACGAQSSSYMQASPQSIALPQRIELAEDLRIERLVDGVWLHRSTGTWQGQPVESNGLLLEGRFGSTLIDTTWTDAQTERLLIFARDRLDKPVRDAIITHAHQDRIGGIAALHSSGVQTWSIALTAERARANGTQAPQNTMPSEHHFNFDGVSLDTLFAGAGHAPDNVVVYLPERGILFGGCMVRALNAGIGNLEDADLASWRVAIQAVRNRFQPATQIVPGHGEPGGPNLLMYTEEEINRSLSAQSTTPED